VRCPVCCEPDSACRWWQARRRASPASHGRHGTGVDRFLSAFVDVAAVESDRRHRQCVTAGRRSNRWRCGGWRRCDWLFDLDLCGTVADTQVFNRNAVLPWTARNHCEESHHPEHLDNGSAGLRQYLSINIRERQRATVVEVSANSDRNNVLMVTRGKSVTGNGSLAASSRTLRALFVQKPTTRPKSSQMCSPNGAGNAEFSWSCGVVAENRSSQGPQRPPA